MKFTKEIRNEFMDKFIGKQFSLNDVIEFLSPYMAIDAEKAIEQKKKNISRNFIASFKDDSGIRHFFSYKDEDIIKYAYSSGNLDIKTANLILANLNSKQKGLYKASRKIRKRIHIIYGQMSLMDSQPANN